MPASDGIPATYTPPACWVQLPARIGAEYARGA
jgi:hypothetical protein